MNILVVIGNPRWMQQPFRLIFSWIIGLGLALALLVAPAAVTRPVQAATICVNQ